MTTHWLLVAGDFRPNGGMDMANYGLASYLARHGASEVHLIAHHVSGDLASLPGVRACRVARPLGAHCLGEPILRRAAQRRLRQLTGTGVRTVANGGNVDAGDVNWVHYVHAAFEPPAGGFLNHLRVRSNRLRHLREERAALRRAKIVICNSRRTADDVVRLVGVARNRTRVVYYGIDAERFGPIDPHAREAARHALGISDNRAVALFIGALADRRKGFDTLWSAWVDLVRNGDWDGELLVAGRGAELAKWQALAARQPNGGRVRFLGFRRDVPALLAASDLLVHPTRYEAYGLAVHEALCRGIPAIVSAQAGVAEQYPDTLRGLLLSDPESPAELTARLRAWRGDPTIGESVASFAPLLRSRTWDHMAHDISRAIEDTAAA